MAVSVATRECVAVVTIDNPPVNAAGHAVRAELMEALSSTASDPGVEAVVLICAGRTFVAGADVREFGQPLKEPGLPDVVAAIEMAPKPWIAAIHGTALGGGLEIALGCHYRLAVATAKLGLPEVSLGLIPGAGGTVRLPRLIAAGPALEMIASGKPVSAGKARKLGLVDRIARGDLLSEATEFAKVAATSPLPVPLRDRPPNLPDDPDAWAAQKGAVARKARGQRSPVAACEAVQTALDQPFDAALAAERATFLSLKDDPQSRALRHVFFAERAAGKIAEADGVSPNDLTHAGIVGGGTMGAGIAAACLLAGLRVTMIERNRDALSAGQGRVTGILNGSLTRGLITSEAHTAMLDAFAGSTHYADLSDADLVIEAVFEDMDVKRQVFAQLDDATRPDAVLASNTSYLDIGEIASAVARPSRVIGLHFFSPAHVMKLLELVIPAGAAPEAVATGVALGKRLRKVTVAAGVCDGFVGNRIMSRYRRDCDRMLTEGALPHQIDAAMRAFGFPMGIYEMQDLAGLDIGWAMRKRRAASRDRNESQVTVADQLCEMGRFGRKTGLGWYRYDDGKTATRDPDVEALILAEAASKNTAPRSFDAAAIMDRILAEMQSEGRKVLDEGIARRASDIDVVMINGYGFPRWRGGPMYMTDT